MSPSFGGTRDSGISCGAKWMVMSSDVVLLPKSDIVERDHEAYGSAAAFFRESMRRDAMVGTKIVFTLGTRN